VIPLVFGHKYYVLRVKCPDDESWRDYKQYNQPLRLRDLREEDPDVEELIEQGCSLAMYEIDGNRKKQLWHRRGKAASAKQVLELRGLKVVESVMSSIMPAIASAIRESITAVAEQYKAVVDATRKNYEMLIDKLLDELKKREEPMTPQEYLASILYTLNEAEQLAKFFYEKLGKRESGGGGSFLEELAKFLGMLQVQGMGVQSPMQQMPQPNQQIQQPQLLQTPIEAAQQPMQQMQQSQPPMQQLGMLKIEVPEEYQKLAEELLSSARQKTVEKLAVCRQLGTCEEEGGEQ